MFIWSKIADREKEGSRWPLRQKLTKKVWGKMGGVYETYLADADNGQWTCKFYHFLSGGTQI